MTQNVILKLFAGIWFLDIPFASLGIWKVHAEVLQFLFAYTSVNETGFAASQVVKIFFRVNHGHFTVIWWTNPLELLVLWLEFILEKVVGFLLGGGVYIDFRIGYNLLFRVILSQMSLGLQNRKALLDPNIIENVLLSQKCRSFFVTLLRVRQMVFCFKIWCHPIFSIIVVPLMNGGVMVSRLFVQIIKVVVLASHERLYRLKWNMKILLLSILLGFI